MSRSRSLVLALSVPVVLLIAAQLVPFQKDHTNPPDGVVTKFDSPATQKLAERACFDCHSNRTKWPWYASIAPISWRIGQHVQEGREKLNFTAFEAGNEKMADAAGEAGESVTKGQMPPADYLLMHPEARLTATEKAALVRGLDASLAAYGEKGGESGEGAVAEGGSANGRAEESEASERAEHRGERKEGHDRD